MNENISLVGRVKLYSRGRLVAESHNMVVSAGKALIGDMLIDRSGYDTGITYCALGTDNTAPALTDTTLGTETSRKALTLKERAANVLLIQVYFLASESNVHIKEVGLFGHSTASTAADSGVLFARALLDFDNSGGSPSDVTIQWEITIG